MEDIKDEIKDNNSPIPISIEGMENILNQMKYSVCKIYKDDGVKGTGFFCKIKLKNSLLPVLITNNHILDDKDIDTNKIIEITFNDNKEFRNINIDKSRIKFTKKEIDITLIEIKPEIDKINNFIEIDEEINNDINILEKIYRKKSVYILHYQNSNNIKVSYGLLNGINKEIIRHHCNTEEGSSGAPILSLENFKLIGVHKGYHTSIRYNVGIFIKYVIEEINRKNINFNAKLNIEANKRNLEFNITNYLNTNNNINNKEYNNNYKFNNISQQLLLKNELKAYQEDGELKKLGCNFGLEESNNFYKWRCILLGPKNTPYDGGFFILSIEYGLDYPNHGAQIKFKNKIFHPTINLGENSENLKGLICNPSLNSWKEKGKVDGKPFNLKKAIFEIVNLLHIYQYKGYICEENRIAYELFKKNPNKFNEEARKWTKQFASKFF